MDDAQFAQLAENTENTACALNRIEEALLQMPDVPALRAIAAAHAVTLVLGQQMPGTNEVELGAIFLRVYTAFVEGRV